MVCGGMGLLDDAIREHLELKRLKGADPGEVARAEHDALGSTPEQESGETYGADGQSHEQSGARDHVDEPHHEGMSQAAATAVGQETVEFDMSSVVPEATGEDSEPAMPSAGVSGRPRPTHSLDEDAGAPVGGMDNNAAPSIEGDVHGRGHAEEDSIEWEVPTDNTQAVEESVEDVLEETPDFLRETPDQERLWFEQSPPRDFDFNE
jgi:hypothetical protein